MSVSINGPGDLILWPFLHSNWYASRIKGGEPSFRIWGRYTFGFLSYSLRTRQMDGRTDRRSDARTKATPIAPFPTGRRHTKSIWQEIFLSLNNKRDVCGCQWKHLAAYATNHALLSIILNILSIRCAAHDEWYHWKKHASIASKNNVKNYHLTFLLFKESFNNFLQVVATQRNFWLICRTWRRLWHTQYVQYNTLLIENLPAKVARHCQQDQNHSSNKTEPAAVHRTWQHVIHFILWCRCKHLHHKPQPAATINTMTYKHII